MNKYQEFLDMFEIPEDEIYSDLWDHIHTKESENEES